MIKKLVHRAIISDVSVFNVIKFFYISCFFFPYSIIVLFILCATKCGEIKVFTSRSKVILFKRYCPDTKTHTEPTALPGPLKRSVKITNNFTNKYRLLK